MDVETHEEKIRDTGSEPIQQKKLRKFSAKEFRTQLHGDQKLIALQGFMQQIKENTSQDCALEYIQKNGNIHELLECMEKDSTLPPVLMLEIINELLLRIISCKLDCKDAAYESCRYLLNNFVAILNKMLGLASSSKERIITLKLLTTMATFSSFLSKDILIHVNFNQTNLELITKNTLENKTVRKHFIYFLTAVLIDVEYPTLSLLLEKKGMLTSIIPGLQYDEMDTVCFMLTAMKNNILENQFVSKTVKMKTFNTIVVKNIVNLYNWKGPSNLKASKKDSESVQVDDVQKAKVSECVHNFLMVLCTSHKCGVIFRDSLVGMGKKTQNALIYTVLDSMDSPWDHSYASELVIKICAACPDLTKYIWNNLKASIQPRNSVKWLKVIDFVKRLLEELQPSILEPYIKHLNVNQISQIITILVAPLPILKILLPENNIYELQITRYNVSSLIKSILESIQIFITASETWLNKEQFSKLKTDLANYVERNFPSGEVLLNNWKEEDKTEEPTGYNPLAYLSLVFDILESYINISPELLETLKFSHNDLKDLMESMDFLCANLMFDEKDNLQVKIIDLFLHVNPSVFALNSESFNFFLTYLFKISHVNVRKNDFRSISVLKKLLKTTKIFDYGSAREISVWINGIFGLKSYNGKISEFLTAAFKLTDLKTGEYLQNIMNRNIKNEGISEDNNYLLSPLLMGVIEYSNTSVSEKSIISYLNFVIPNLTFLQSNPLIISQILRNSKLFEDSLEFVDAVLGEDVMFENLKILKVFGKHDIFNRFNVALANDNFQVFLTETEQNLSLYPDLKLDLLQMGIFYFSKLSEIHHPQESLYSKNLIIYIDFILHKTDISAEIILNHSALIKNFSILELNDDGDYNCCTKFFMNFMKIFSEKQQLQETDYFLLSEKILNMLLKIVKNPKKYDDVRVVEVMKIFKMNSEVYSNIILKISDHISEKIVKCKYKVFHSILVYCLDEYCKFAKYNTELQLPEKVCENLFKYHILLNETTGISSSDLSNALLSYLSIFPQNVEQVDANLINSMLNSTEYDKSNIDLLIFILEKKRKFIHCIDANLDNLISTKGILYPVLQMLSRWYKETSDIDENPKKSEIEALFHKTFVKFEDILHKALRKPQKASQHLDNNYHGILTLIELNFRIEKFQEYVIKVQKFEVTKIFHVYLLYTIFKKFIETEVDSKIVNNSLLTFVHLLVSIMKRIPKNEEHTRAIVNSVADCFTNYLNDMKRCSQKWDFKSLPNNESFKLMLKFCLKYGVSEHEQLLQLLKQLIILLSKNFDDEQIKLIMEMLVSHSEFLDVVLSENHKCKFGILSLMSVVCESWPQVMDRSHVPILLSSYGATLTESDKIILKLLKMYESARNQTSFNDFKPYLWGNTGANHYSVRSGIEKALLKQPRMGDVLNILQENTVVATIKNYVLYHSKGHPQNLKENTIYDLEFLLPLFSHLLAPENVVQTYHFTKSGALSLSIIGLSSENRNMRTAACHVLARFYFHVEARQTGKDNLLWIRLIEAICRGISVTSELTLNNFASIFLARTALILTQPNHVMYLPLSQYLAAKPILDFSSIPELYTFLHSSDVHYKEHRNFIFEIMCDGLICDNDYTIFFRSLALKLFTELYSSCSCDFEAKMLILDILVSVCRLPIGVKFICTHNAIIEYLVMDLEDQFRSTSDKPNIGIICKIIQVLCLIFSNLDDSCIWGRLLLTDACQRIVESKIFNVLPDSTCKTLVEITQL